MARGSTRGERRRARRRRRHRSAAPTPPPPPAERPRDPNASIASALVWSDGPDPDAEHDARRRYADAIAGRWGRRVWGTPVRRLGTAGSALAILVAVFVGAVEDPDELTDGGRDDFGFTTLPALIVPLAAQVLESLADVVRGRDTTPPLLHRLRARLGGAGVAIYLVASIVVMIGVREVLVS